MLNIKKASILVILIPLTLTLSGIDGYQDEQLDNGTKDKIVSIGPSLGLKIFTKYEKSSKIIVKISADDKPINTTNIYYGRAKQFRETVKSEDKPTCTTSGNSVNCLYNVKKEGDYNYGVLIIKELSLFKQIIVSVDVVSDSFFYIIIISVFIGLIILIVGFWVVCTKFYRCLCCKR